MEKILAYLEQLDLSEIEAKLYLTLLETGPTSVRDIANAIGIKRTTAYLYVDQLAEKGLITKMVHGSRPQIMANPPESSLESLVHAKVEKTKTIQGQFPTMLEAIHTTLSTRKDLGDVEIRYYKGKSGVRKIYEEALQSKEIRSYFNNEIVTDALNNIDLFIERMEKNKDIKVFEIVQDSPVARKQLIDFQENNPSRDRYFYKFFPHGISLSAADVLIYENNVAIINARNQVSGVILHNSDYYKSTKEIFDLVWKVLPEVK